MIVYSHSKTDAQEITYGSKELKNHIKGVKEKALSHLSNNLDLGFTDSEIKELLELVVDFHDFGKYTTYFQDYVLKKPDIKQDLKRHAQIGGFVAYNLLQNVNEKKALLALYVIFQHHSQLIDILELRSKLNRYLEDIIDKQIENLSQSLDIVEKDLNRTSIKEYLFYTEERKLRRGFKQWAKKEASIQDYFLINYLFSLLIEADKLDASDTEVYHLKNIADNVVDKRFGLPEINNQNLSDLNNNELRNYCRAVVVSHINDEAILNEHLFTLTAPTGVGKTMTALDFALKLKARLKQEQNIQSRIIYALPFVNIIEQALSEYKKTLDEEGVRILGHYQYADVFGENKASQKNGESEQNYNQKLMALDTWQGDIVITSFVQFFETLIGNRNRLLKKFNHYANAIIILDEVQTLRLEHIPLLGSVLFYLSKFLKSRVVLMTATRPKIFELAEREVLKEKIKVRELLTNYEEVFSLFNRTTIYPLLNSLISEQEERIHEFIEQVFDEKWSPTNSSLIVVNTVNQSIELYNALEDYLEESNLENPLYYLSTNIIPAVRMECIHQIKKDIQDNKNPVLIATQVVEAGVDLDFDMGFRDIGPIDSIVQVAGRVNRNNNPEKAGAPLYIIDFNAKATCMVYGRLTYNQTKKSLEQQECFKEEEYLKLVNFYFDGIADKSSFAKSRELFKSMESLKYDAENKQENPISSFKIIEDSNRYTPVFVEIDDEARILVNRYLQKITGEISNEEYNKKYKLAFQQHIISAPSYLCDDLETINEYDDGILIIPNEEIGVRYNIETGFNRKYEDRNQVLVL